jgi:hypothetical protein
MKVVLTGTERLSAPLAADLEALGLEVETCPLVAVEELDGPPLRADGYDWLLLTSRNGVDALFQRLQGPLPRVGVVGPGTAGALREQGVEPDLVAAVSTQEGLAAELPRPAGRVLFAGAEDARRTAAFLENLAVFIRYALTPPDRLVAISDEIECVNRYIWLLTLRFRDRFTFDVGIDQRILRLEVPALILQPLVENALYHGIKERDDAIYAAPSAREALRMGNDGIMCTRYNQATPMDTWERAQLIPFERAAVPVWPSLPLSWRSRWCFRQSGTVKSSPTFRAIARGWAKRMWCGSDGVALHNRHGWAAT